MSSIHKKIRNIKPASRAKYIDALRTNIWILTWYPNIIFTLIKLSNTLRAFHTWFYLNEIPLIWGSIFDFHKKHLVSDKAYLLIIFGIIESLHRDT